MAKPEQFAIVERLTAERDALHDALAQLVADRKGFEFSTPKQQASLRNARALLVEIQRSPTEAK